MKCVKISGFAHVLCPVVMGTGSLGMEVSEIDSFHLLDAFISSGGNVIDTAHIYGAWINGGDGKSEKTIGKWLQTNKVCRSDICIGTKGGHPDFNTGESRITYNWIKKHLFESLERLKTDYIDIYWLHRDDLDVPVGEILEWLNEFMSDGYVRTIGCSNWTCLRQIESESYARKHGLTPFFASQIGFSLATFNKEFLPYAGMVYMNDDTFNFHKNNRIPVFAYSSQAGGFFSGKYNFDNKVNGCNQKKEVKLAYGSEENFKRLRAATELAKHKGFTINQIALAFLMHQPFPVFPIVGPKTVEQLIDSLNAIKCELNNDDLESLIPN